MAPFPCSLSTGDHSNTSEECGFGYVGILVAVLIVIAVVVVCITWRSRWKWALHYRSHLLGSMWLFKMDLFSAVRFVMVEADSTKEPSSLDTSEVFDGCGMFVCFVAMETSSPPNTHALQSCNLPYDTHTHTHQNTYKHITL